MPAKHSEGHARNGPARQPDQRRERDHRRSDHEDHASGKVVEIEIEPPAKLDQRELNQDQPKAADEQEVAKLFGGFAPAIEESRKAREQDESRRAKVRYPAGEKKCGFSHIAGIEVAGAEEVTRMI